MVPFWMPNLTIITVRFQEVQSTTCQRKFRHKNSESEAGQRSKGKDVLVPISCLNRWADINIQYVSAKRHICEKFVLDFGNKFFEMFLKICGHFAVPAQRGCCLIYCLR